MVSFPPGETAVTAAGLILPKINAFGGSSLQVKNAVKRIELAGSADRLFKRTIPHGPEFADVYPIKRMEPDVRLALEMAAHEETERRALEGELSILEAAWREAEEIADISDRLLIPKGVEEFIDKYKTRLLGER